MTIFTMKWYYRRWLHNWAGDSVLKEMPHVKIKRRFEESDFFVDVYWVMQDTETGKNIQYYNRVRWEHLTTQMKRFERKTLEQYFIDCKK